MYGAVMALSSRKHFFSEIFLVCPTLGKKFLIFKNCINKFCLERNTVIIVRYAVFICKAPCLVKLLTHLMSLISFYTLWKHEKTRGFLVFSGGIERDKWHDMGWWQVTAWNLSGSSDCSFKSHKQYFIN